MTDHTRPLGDVCAVERVKPSSSPLRRDGEDRVLLEAAAALNRDLAQVTPWIYWTDLLLTALIAYASFAGALLLPQGALAVALGVVAALAFYRGISFIHELTHIKSGSLRGFRTVWNLLIGIPLFVPSFLYDDVHTLHHAKTSYGTARDPEYVPLASMRPRAIVMFVSAAALAPIGLFVRFAVLSVLGVASPRIRLVVAERYSALAINSAFRRRAPTGTFKREWIMLETAASLWALSLVVMTATGILGFHSLVIGLVIGSGVAVINQVRTLAAHLWENESGLPMSLTDQYLDSVNVPPPSALPALWAPVELRYHGLHHLLPSIPYHALGLAHRRLSEKLEPCSVFHRGNHAGLRSLFARIARTSSVPIPLELESST